MRFAMVTTFYPPYGFGGDGTYVRALSRALVEQGHEVEVVHCVDAFQLLARGAAQLDEPDDPGIVVHRIKSPFGPLSPIITQQTGRPGLKSYQLKRILERRFDVIHFHNISLIGGPGILRLGNAPCKLYTLHEHWLICPSHIFWKNRSRACDKPECFSCSIRSGIPPQLWRYTGLRNNALRSVDRLIAPSKYTADRHRLAGVDNKIEVIPLFSALENVPPAGPVIDGLGSSYFLFVGRVTASKGIHSLVRTVASTQDIHLVVVGDGDLRAGLERDYGGYTNVRFLGPLPQSQLSRVYAGARALILPSLAPETFGLTVIEAAERGVPSIVRDGAGGAPEIVRYSGGGVLYCGEDELVSLLRRLASRPKLTERLARRARWGYLRHFTREAHLTRYLRCVEDVLSEKRCHTVQSLALA